MVARVVVVVRVAVVVVVESGVRESAAGGHQLWSRLLCKLCFQTI